MNDVCVDITGAAGGGNHTVIGYLRSQAANSAVDVVGVAGDVTECTNGSFHVTDGVRRGDPVEIVQQAIVSGDVGADSDGASAVVILGGNYYIENALFRYLGFNATTDITPNVVAQYSFLTAQNAGNTAHAGFLRDSEFWQNEGDVADIATILIGSHASSAGAPRVSGSPRS